MSRTRLPGTECRIFVDGIPMLKVGDYLRTRAGSAYLVTEIKQNRNQAQRRNLRCIRSLLWEIPAEAAVFNLFWYPRKRKARR